MNKSRIIVTPNHFLYQDVQLYHLKLQGVGNQATGYLYCKNNETVSRAVSMDKIQLEGLCKVKQVIALRHKAVMDIKPILEAHNWEVIPISENKMKSMKVDKNNN
ncbi:MAG: hypothetical protein F6K40_18790 [Okeania sp. SIO3I5]|uniref:hypothetical protein n=1 Tax=Okeania sp. SIO3I5 TaxID=2607805 RepID=UPI0013BD8AE5|nr:hypothetical protein [Okeania sp. SIO3I5]NEQ38196.1 hypothetical protein [Okeania sp. SIO3I5]